MSADDHVFIVGLPRTGTSLMYRTIQRLSAFRPARLNLFETKIFCDSVSFDGTDLRYRNLVGYFLWNDELYDAFLQAVRPHTAKLRSGAKSAGFNVIAAGDLLGSWIAWPMKWRWRLGPKSKIIREYFAFAAKARKCRRIVEKTPHHYQHVHKILWTFPRAHVIWMMRHPIEVLTSSINRSRVDEEYGHYWTVDSFVGEYRHSLRVFDCFNYLFNGNIILVKYEDLVSDPAAIMQRVCDAIREPFTADALELKPAETPTWDIADRHLLGAITRDTGKEWKALISQEEATKIERLLAREMNKLGFRFYTSAK